MRGVIAGLMLVASALAGGASAQTAAPLSEEEQWQLIGKTWSLDQETRTRIFEADIIRRAIERVGIARGCPIVEQQIDDAVALNEARYRTLAIQTINDVYPADEFYESRFTFMPNGGRNSVLRKIMVRRDPAFFAKVANEVEGAALAPLKQLSPATDDWRGRFSDWLFKPENARTYQIACMLETSSNPDDLRRAFDGCYQTRD